MTPEDRQDWAVFIRDNKPTQRTLAKCLEWSHRFDSIPGSLEIDWDVIARHMLAKDRYRSK